VGTLGIGVQRRTALEAAHNKNKKRIPVTGNLRTRTGRAALVTTIAMGLVLGGGSGAFAGGQQRPHAGVASAKAKPTVVTIVVGDTKGLGGPMTMTVTPASAPAGKVKFVGKNTGTIIHEVIVLKTKTAFDKLTIDSKGKVSEAKSVGEISEFGKQKTKSVILKLKKGHYVLVCNVAKHYSLGMRVDFNVT